MTRFHDAISALLAIHDSDAPADSGNVYTGHTRADKLRDFVDYVELILMKRKDTGRRAGRSSFKADAVNPFRPAPDLAEALQAASNCTPADRRMLVQIAQQLAHALAPVKANARGVMQVKRVNGRPYLYYRYYTGTGGNDRSQSRLKSVYIGLRDVAEFVESLPARESQADEKQAREKALEAIRDAYLENGKKGIDAVVKKLVKDAD